MDREAAYLVLVSLWYHKHTVISLENYAHDPHPGSRVKCGPKIVSAEIGVIMIIWSRGRVSYHNTFFLIQENIHMLVNKLQASKFWTKNANISLSFKK